MVREPAVFLMDEPLSNLDAALRTAMRAEIKQLHTAMQTTFVYVTHDQAEALTLADRIVVMRDGVVQQVGSPDELYERPRNTFVASFLGHPPINLLDGTIERTGDTIAFSRGDLRIALPLQLAVGIGEAIGRAVLLGIRPEDVLSHGAATNPLSGVVTSVLPAGSDRFLGLKVAGCDVFVRVGKEARAREGDVVTLELIPDRLHLFDKASGVSLRAEGVR
jgi:multiple sugar transport system ATP-binding protein